MNKDRKLKSKFAVTLSGAREKSPNGFFVSAQNDLQAKSRHVELVSVSRGRSMVEMLVVLGIIGLLSIGGVSGMKTALNKNQENKVLDEANLQGVEILTNRHIKMNGEEIRYPYSSDYIISRTFDADRKNIILKTNTLPESVCQNVATKSNQGIFGDITCDATNVLTFKIPISGKSYQIGGGSDNTGGVTGGSSGTGSDDNTTITDPCENKECGKCEKCENGSCVENPAMNDLSCGTNKYCRYGECLECGSVQETCASDAWGSNGCQTHKHKDCESNQYCDAAGICRDCPTQACDTSCCALTGPKDVCNNPTPQYGSDAIYYVNNANGCLVEKTGCSLTKPADETQSCGGDCDNGDCIETCSTTLNACMTGCEKVNGVENKTFASNTTSCGTAGLCDGQGACVECSAIDNCATLTSEKGKCECATCKTGYELNDSGACEPIDLCKDFVADTCTTACATVDGNAVYTYAVSTACGTNGYCSNGECVECLDTEVPTAIFDACETPTVCDARTTSSCTGTTENGCSYSCTPGYCKAGFFALTGGLCASGYCDLSTGFAAYNKSCPLFDDNGNYIGYQHHNDSGTFYLPDGTYDDSKNPQDYRGYTENGNSTWADTCLEWDRATGPTGRKVVPGPFSSMGCGGGN